MIKKVISKACKPLSVLFVLLALLLYVDYNGIPSYLGINISNLNLDVISITVNILIATTVFILTYFLIQQRELEIQNNQKEIAKHLIRTCMSLCEDYIYELDKPGIAKMMLRVNNETEPEIKDRLTFFSKYEDNPFEYNNTITQFMINGILSDTEMEQYEKAKNLYKSYVTAFIIYSGNKDEEKQQLLYDLKQKALEAALKAK